MSDYKNQTKAARAGVDVDEQHGAVMAPIYLSSNFTFKGIGDKRQYDYTRGANPTRANLEGVLADLEGGAGCVVVGTGMAAVDLPFNLVDNGELILLPHDCYGATQRLVNAYHRKGTYRIEYVDQTDEAALRAAFEQKPAMILVETPSNPLLRVTDFALVRELATAHGTLVVADNTFLSPILQQPIALGADIVVHSTTKYINGHGDVTGGAVIGATPELAQELAWWANCKGTTGMPFDSYLTLRGTRTLELRILHAQKSAARVAEFLDNHPAIAHVNYPGLPSHPHHDLAKRQQKGFGAMLSFDFVGGQDAARKLIDKVELFTLAVSLGGFESLICHPPTMSHGAMDEAALELAGISQSLLRLSIGLEDADDLIADLDQALASL